MAKIEFVREPSKSTKQANPPYIQIHELIYARPRIPATQSPSSATDSRNPRNGEEIQETRNLVLPENGLNPAPYRDAARRELLTRVRGGAGVRACPR